MPERIQLRRTRGWRKPEGAIIVARPSLWGNWYKVLQAKDDYPQYAHTLVDSEAWIVQATDKRGWKTGAHWGGFTDKLDATRFAVEMYRRALEATYLTVDGPINRRSYLRGLAGHDLACWCPIEDADGNRYPCHADVLLTLANDS